MPSRHFGGGHGGGQAVSPSPPTGLLRAEGRPAGGRHQAHGARPWFPLEVVVCPTVREPDGLALSSHAHLDAEEHRAAAVLSGPVRGPPLYDGERGRRCGGDAGGNHSGRSQRRSTSVADRGRSGTDRVEDGALLIVGVRIGRTRLIDNLALGEREVAMFLAVDIGNTSITLGLFRMKRWAPAGASPPTTSAPPDEYGHRRAAARARGVSCREVGDRDRLGDLLTGTFQRVCREYLHAEPLVVDAGTDGDPVRYEDPKQVGADRVVNAVACAASTGVRPASSISARRPYSTPSRRRSTSGRHRPGDRHRFRPCSAGQPAPRSSSPPLLGHRPQHRPLPAIRAPVRLRGAGGGWSPFRAELGPGMKAIGTGSVGRPSPGDARSTSWSLAGAGGAADYLQPEPHRRLTPWHKPPRTM